MLYRRFKLDGYVIAHLMVFQQNGGMFLAVCRGKVSEGIDFANNNARAVICVRHKILLINISYLFGIKCLSVCSFLAGVHVLL